MSGPSCKIYFNNEVEYHSILKFAAQHNLTLPQYIHACTIEQSNIYIKNAEAALKAQAEKAAELSELGETNEPPGPTSETDSEEASAENAP